MCQTDETRPLQEHDKQRSRNTPVKCSEREDRSLTAEDIGQLTKHKPRGTAYKADPSLEPSSLSLRLMHKPSRAQNEFEKASDPTQQNSLFNAFLENCQTTDSSSLPESLPSREETCSSPSANAAEGAEAMRLNLVRKKSGEIVKLLLKERGSSISTRSRSLPSTPTYKQVHFGGDNDVRYFKKKDKPTAILALSSPQEYEDDEDDNDDIPRLAYGLEGHLRSTPVLNSTASSYFDYYDDELNSHADHHIKSTSRAAKRSDVILGIDWEITHLNFSSDEGATHKIEAGRQVFLETLSLSNDERTLIGYIAVKNLTYEKAVFIRYSTDKWCTIVEIQAFYVPGVSATLKENNYDRFMFEIPVDMFVNGFYSSVDPLCSTPTEINTEMCMRYHIGGIDIWDNNEGQNYKFNLHKKAHETMNMKNVPSTARTKQETHKKRPKYSSSYLKRIKSDSSIAKNMASLSLDESAQQLSPMSTSPTSSVQLSSKHSGENTSSWNDFENNNFYLSSPLFSSLSRRESDNVPPIVQGGNSSDRSTQKDASASRPELLPKQKCLEGDYVSREFSPETDSDLLPTMSRNAPEPMSYQDFLKSYCFFNSSTNDNSSKTTLVMSDNPSSLSEVHTDFDTKADPAYTVSSFLT